MPTIRIPTPLRPYTGGEGLATVQGATVAEALQDLLGQHPDLRPHLFNPQGRLRPYMNVFVDDDPIRDLQGLDTPLAADSQLKILPSIAGG